MSKPDPIIIGLTGPKGAGKDTVADFLVEQHGYVRMAFGDAIRNEICAAFNVQPQVLTERETKEHPLTALALDRCLDDAFVQRMRLQFASGLHGQDGIEGEKISLTKPRSPRQIMQWWGTEFRRAQRPNYWTFKLEDAIGNAYKSGQNRFVITDVRFADEADMLLGLGATIWQIQRPGHEPQPGEHSSESTGAQFAPHFVLTNNASITHLHSQAYAALKKQDQLRHLTAQLAELESEQAREFPAMDADLALILGTMCFECIPYVQCFRMAGQEVARKAEAEQAAVLHWMLTHYFRAGSNWRESAQADLNRMQEVAKSNQAATQGATA